MVLFEPLGSNGQPAYMNKNGLFQRGDLAKLCKLALADAPTNTHEVAAWVIYYMGRWRPLFRTAIAYRIVQALRTQVKRGVGFRRVEKGRNVVIWTLQ